MTEIDIQKDFLSNVDYLKLLVKKLQSKPVSKYDSNLIYEAVYAHMYLSDIEAKAKEPTLVTDIHELRMTIEAIIDLLPNDLLEAEKDKVNYKDILKAKYKDIKDASYTEEVAYTDSQSANREYFRNKVPAYGTLLLLICVGMVVEAIEDYAPASVSPTFISFFKGFVFLFHMISYLCVMIMILGVTFDLLYIHFPFVRTILPFNTHFVSDEAKKTVELMSESVSLKQVTNYNRLERNRYWLDSMLKNVKLLENKGLPVNEQLILALNDINEKLPSMDSTSKDYYYSMAEVEFLHDKYLEELDNLHIIL
jgi:hypothetical protein